VVGQIITTGIIIGMKMEDNYVYFYWDDYFLPQFIISAPPRNPGLGEAAITHGGPLFALTGMGFFFSCDFSGAIYSGSKSSIHIDF
jgi:hypothetical protein